MEGCVNTCVFGHCTEENIAENGKLIQPDYKHKGGESVMFLLYKS